MVKLYYNITDQKPNLSKKVDFKRLTRFNVRGTGLIEEAISVPDISDHVRWLVEKLRENSSPILDFHFVCVFNKVLNQDFSLIVDAVRFKNVLHFSSLVSFYLSVNNLPRRQKPLLWLSLATLENLKHLTIHHYTQKTHIRPYLRNEYKFSLETLDFYWSTNSMDFYYLIKHPLAWDVDRIVTRFHKKSSVWHSSWEKAEIKQVLAYFAGTKRVKGTKAFARTALFFDFEEANYLETYL